VRAAEENKLKKELLEALLKKGLTFAQFKEDSPEGKAELEQ